MQGSCHNENWAKKKRAADATRNGQVGRGGGAAYVCLKKDLLLAVQCLLRTKPNAPFFQVASVAEQTGEAAWEGDPLRAKEQSR